MGFIGQGGLIGLIRPLLIGTGGARWGSRWGLIGLIRPYKPYKALYRLGFIGPIGPKSLIRPYKASV